jgi:hypothetical protein
MKPSAVPSIRRARTRRENSTRTNSTTPPKTPRRHGGMAGNADDRFEPHIGLVNLRHIASSDGSGDLPRSESFRAAGHPANNNSFRLPLPRDYAKAVSPSFRLADDLPGAYVNTPPLGAFDQTRSFRIPERCLANKMKSWRPGSGY